MDEIRDKGDIEKLVSLFYDRVRNDKTVGPIFINRIDNESWPGHLKKMVSFWNTVLFGISDYRGNPFSHHIDLNLTKEHFERWLFLFEEVITKHFYGDKAEEALMRAIKMKMMFESKLDLMKSSKQFKIM